MYYSFTYNAHIYALKAHPNGKEANMFFVVMICRLVLRFLVTGASKLRPSKASAVSVIVICVSMRLFFGLTRGILILWTSNIQIGETTRRAQSVLILQTLHIKPKQTQGDILHKETGCTCTYLISRWPIYMKLNVLYLTLLWYSWVSTWMWALLLNTTKA